MTPGLTEIRICGFLQNAWSPHYAGRTWPREFWIRALARSRSGQRLSIFDRYFAPEEIWWDNTTPIVGAEPSSVVPPDHNHMRQVIEHVQPDRLIAFGRQAADALLYFRQSGWLFDRPILIVPHPAWRLLTDELFDRAAKQVREGFTGVLDLRPGAKRRPRAGRKIEMDQMIARWNGTVPA